MAKAAAARKIRDDQDDQLIGDTPPSRRSPAPEAPMRDADQGELHEAAGWTRPDGANVVALGQLTWLPIGSLIPSPLNPRKQFDDTAIDELATSIGREGLLQPLTAREAAKDLAKGHKAVTVGATTYPAFEVYVGGRRTRALQRRVERGEARPTDLVPVNVRPCADIELLDIAMHENLQRRDLEPLEEAQGYSMMRRALPKDEGDRRAVQSIARRLGVSERTIQRRLALLKLPQPVQKALRERKIGVGQAEALALFDDPGRALQGVLQNPQDPGNSAEALRDEATYMRTAPSVGDAIFDIALYDGLLSEIPGQSAKDALFVDREQFRRLQRAALDAKIAELKTTHADVVEVARYQREYHSYEKGKGKTAELVAVVTVVGEDLTDIQILERMTKRKPGKAAVPTQATDDDDQPSTTSRRTTKPAPKDPTYITRAQRERVHQVKTRALRRALVEPANRKAMVAVTILGLIGHNDIWIDQRGNRSQPDRVRDPAVDQPLLEALSPMLPSDAADPEEVLVAGGSNYLDDDDVGSMFTKLMALELDRLLELQAFLIAQRVGSWSHWNPPLGDHALQVELAAAIGADRHLAELWQAELVREGTNKAPVDSYFAGYAKSRLLQLGELSGTTVEAGGKKGDLVEALQVAAENDPSRWSPAHFPELLFASDDDVAAAFEGKAPKPKKNASAAALAKATETIERAKAPPAGDGLTEQDRAFGRTAGDE